MTETKPQPPRTCDHRGKDCIGPRGVLYDIPLKKWLCHLCWVHTPIPVPPSR